MMIEKDTLRAKYLYKFLKKHRCLPQFMENLYLRHQNDDNVNNFKKLGDTKLILPIFQDYGSNISNSFAWAKTNEGYDFWSNLDSKFVINFSLLYYDILCLEGKG